MADYGWLSPHFGPAATAVTVATVAFVVMVQPIRGKRRYARLRARRDTDPDAVIAFYRIALTTQAAWIVATLVVLALADNISREDLGLVWPHGSGATQAWGWALYALILIAIGGLLMRRRARSGRSVPGQGVIAALLPRSRREKQLALAVALGAGIAEEVLFRGLFVAAAVGVLHLHAVPAIVVVGLVFGAVHLYQGPLAMIGIAIVGVGLGAVYLMAQSLVVPIVIHVLLDVRGLILVPEGAAGRRPRRRVH